MFVQIMMLLTGIAYAITAGAWLLEGKTWMAATFLLYALTAGTLFMAGRAS